MQSPKRTAPAAPLMAGLLLAAALPPTAGAQSVDPRLMKGQIVTTSVAESGNKIRWGRAEAVVNAPAGQVMAVVQDYQHYNEFLPHFRTSRVLARKGPNAIAYLEARIMKDTVKVWVQVRFRERPPKGKTRIIEGKMTEGNVDGLAVRWEVTPLDEGRTLVAFQMLIDPDLPLPASMINDQNAVSARRTVRALRERVLGAARRTT
jgi:ribosome-associated toxin RatA of RatAB toxin-antitoxin module